MVKKTGKKLKKAVHLGLGAAANPRRTVERVRFMTKRRTVNKARATTYNEWFKAYEKSIDLEEQKRVAKNFKHKPLISIILPIYNTNQEHLAKCVESVIGQTYDNWELCVADDASTTDVLGIVKKFAKGHKNIKWVRLDKNQHIAASSNEALKLASGEFVALLDHDDLLMPNALFEMARTINENPAADLIYSDEDKVEDGNGHMEPFFKPDWSPEFLFSCNYITHFAVLRRSIVSKIGGFRAGTEGAQDWDLFLRFVRETDNIFHVPKMLYSWRKSQTSTAKSAKSKPYAYINQMRVLRDAVADRKLPAAVLASPYLGFWHVKRHPKGNPLVTIVIPTKDNFGYIRRCLESIIENTTYPYFEIILVDTGSTDEEVLKLYESKLITANPITIVRWNKPFSFSGACNLGATKASGEYLLFLNNDTEVITPEWIEGLLGLAQQEHVGMVGCKLLFPSKNIQHAGVVLSQRDIAFHPFYNRHQKLDIFTNIFISNIRNCAAVTAACSMVRKDKFNEVGGFDEALRVTYNDVDLCLKLLEAGYKSVYTPYSELYHYESVSVGKITGSSRNQKEIDQASDLMRKRWAKYLDRDPYYNDNFTPYGPGYDFSMSTAED